MNADWLFAWVKTPEYLPSTKMPNLRLSDEQVAHITAYLITLGAKTDRPGFAQKLADNKVVEAGNRLIGRFGCMGATTSMAWRPNPELAPSSPVRRQASVGNGLRRCPVGQEEGSHHYADRSPGGPL